jgi:hypothetical protein
MVIGEDGIDLPNGRNRCLLRQYGVRIVRIRNKQVFKRYIHEGVLMDNREFYAPVLRQDLAVVVSSRKATITDKLYGARSKIRHNAWSSSDKIPYVVQAN